MPRVISCAAQLVVTNADGMGRRFSIQDGVDAKPNGRRFRSKDLRLVVGLSSAQCGQREHAESLSLIFFASFVNPSAICAESASSVIFLFAIGILYACGGGTQGEALPCLSIGPSSQTYAFASLVLSRS
jgi:hypothetical protein